MVDQEPKHGIYNGKDTPADESGETVIVPEEKREDFDRRLGRAVAKMVGNFFTKGPGANTLERTNKKRLDWSKSTNWKPGPNATSPHEEDKS